MLVAIVDWGHIEKTLMPHLFTEGNFTSEFAITELAVAIAIDGEEIADIRGGGYKGEWGSAPAYAKLFGEKVTPQGFSAFAYAGAQVTIPVDAWEVDMQSPPDTAKDELPALRRRGEETIERMTEYISAFAQEFQRIDVSKMPAKC
jgi:hypothetical protein